MRLVTYDRGGARRLGAWVDRAVVDVPDAVGHPAFPSTMESLVARHGGTTLEAARAALEHPDVVAECAVPGARLLAPILPTSVWRLPGRQARPAAWAGTDLLDREVELACLLTARRGDDQPLAGERWSIFGFALVDWWAEGFGPSIVTADELDRGDPGLVMSVDGRPWMRVSIDAEALRPTVEDLWEGQGARPGAVLVFDAVARPYSRIHRSRVRPGALVDLEPDSTQALRDVAGTT